MKYELSDEVIVTYITTNKLNKMNSQFEEILRNPESKHYYPAQTHYPNTDNGVVCDRCKKFPLLGSIGYLNQDLCYLCADTVSKGMRPSSNVLEPCVNTPPMGTMTLMMQSQIRPPTSGVAMTKMKQSMYKTRMVQKQFS